MSKDPNGLDRREKGAKLDSGKERTGLVLGGFSRALLEVSRVGTFGAAKYTDDGWLHVDNGQARYTDAMLRHYLSECSEGETDKESGLLHAAHLAWNALARLELMLIAESSKEAAKPADESGGGPIDPWYGIDWPEWANWRAIDSDGAMYFYAEESSAGDIAWLFNSERSLCVGKATNFGDWTKTLERKP